MYAVRMVGLGWRKNELTDVGLNYWHKDVLVVMVLIGH